MTPIAEFCLMHVMSSLGYPRVTAVSCQMRAHATIMVSSTTATIPSLKTATHGNAHSCLITQHPADI